MPLGMRRLRFPSHEYLAPPLPPPAGWRLPIYATSTAARVSCTLPPLRLATILAACGQGDEATLGLHKDLRDRPHKFHLAQETSDLQPTKHQRIHGRRTKPISRTIPQEKNKNTYQPATAAEIYEKRYGKGLPGIPGQLGRGVRTR
jgi:hypothetical protein